jgi:hypothetical protein
MNRSLRASELEADAYFGELERELPLNLIRQSAGRRQVGHG